MPESSVRPRRIVVGVSGASGAALGLECLKCLRQAGAESALVVTRGGEITIEQELGMTLDEFATHADVVYDNKNIGAAIASGTYPVDGMIVAPCSMKTLAGIASGYSDNLLLRAADVQMKEQRRLVLMVRETPLHLAHLRNMVAVTEMGGIVCPPLPAFYLRPQTVEDVEPQRGAGAGPHRCRAPAGGALAGPGAECSLIHSCKRLLHKR